MSHSCWSLDVKTRHRGWLPFMKKTSFSKNRSEFLHLLKSSALRKWKSERGESKRVQAPLSLRQFGSRRLGSLADIEVGGSSDYARNASVCTPCFGVKATWILENSTAVPVLCQGCETSWSLGCFSKGCDLWESWFPSCSDHFGMVRGTSFVPWLPLYFSSNLSHIRAHH